MRVFEYRIIQQIQKEGIEAFKEEKKKIADEFSLNPEIEVFLKKVSALQATVADLTPDTLTWLKEKNLTSKLKIRF